MNSKIFKLARLLKFINEVATDKGVLSYEGDIEVGTEVFVLNEDGEIVPALDGEYLDNENNKIIVEGGKISAILAPESPLTEETVEDEKVPSDETETPKEEEEKPIEETPVEETPKEEEEAPVEETEEPKEESVEPEEPKTDEKDEKIAELEAKVAEYEAKIAELESKLKESTSEPAEFRKENKTNNLTSLQRIRNKIK